MLIATNAFLIDSIVLVRGKVKMSKLRNIDFNKCNSTSKQYDTNSNHIAPKQYQIGESNDRYNTTSKYLHLVSGCGV